MLSSDNWLIGFIVFMVKGQPSLKNSFKQDSKRIHIKFFILNTVLKINKGLKYTNSRKVEGLDQCQ